MAAPMSRTSRLLVVAAAWVLPLAWVAFALLGGPSDGTSLSSPLVSPATERWGETVVVERTYGETPLRRGDEVRSVDGRTVGDWLRSGDAIEREVGDVVRYEVLRAGRGLDLIQQVDVTLAPYPLEAALRAEVLALGLVGALLLAGSAVFWVRPDAAASRAFLAGAALLPARRWRPSAWPRWSPRSPCS